MVSLDAPQATSLLALPARNTPALALFTSKRRERPPPQVRVPWLAAPEGLTVFLI